MTNRAIMNKFFVYFFLLTLNISSYIFSAAPFADSDINTLEVRDEKISSLLNEHIANIRYPYYCVQNVTDDIGVATGKSHQKMGIFVFKAPQPEEYYHLREHEKIIAQTVFPRFIYQEKDGYSIITSFYVEEPLLPTTRAQAIALLCSPYCTSPGTQKSLPLNPLQQQIISCRNEFVVNDEEGLCGDTIIQTKQGYYPISALKVGDKIAACDLYTGEKTFSTITRIERAMVQSHVCIQLNNETLIVAPGQQFNVSENKKNVLFWIAAQRLVFLPDCWKLIHPLITNVQEVKESRELYRLTIEENHNFFITHDDILVHNFIPLLAATLYFGGDTITYEVLVPTAAAIMGYLTYKAIDLLHDFVVGGRNRASERNLHPYIAMNEVHNECTIHPYSYPFITSHQDVAKEVPKTKTPPKTSETPKEEEKGKEKEKSTPTKTFDDIWKDTKPGKKTKGKSTQRIREGGWAQAEEDFNSLEVNNKRESEGGKKILGLLPNGNRVNAREDSQDGRPTLESYDPRNGRSKKIRYEKAL